MGSPINPWHKVAGIAMIFLVPILGVVGLILLNWAILLR